MNLRAFLLLLLGLAAYFALAYLACGGLADEELVPRDECGLCEWKQLTEWNP